jgi:membrane protein DedA with SNARE-associated domain
VGGVFYAGFVAGPPILGVAAQGSSLRLAWLVVVMLLGVALALTPWLSRQTNEKPLEAAA